MVKNHALKNTARARKAETGETFPEAMRNSLPSTVTTNDKGPRLMHVGNGVFYDMNTGKPTPTIFLHDKRFPIIHLGNGAFHDMNTNKPNLNIRGEGSTVKTLITKHIISELIKAEAACSVIVITGKEGEYKAFVENAPTSGRPHLSLIQNVPYSDQSAIESMLGELALKAQDESNTEYRDVPLVLVVDEVGDVSSEAMSKIQDIAKHGVPRDIYTLVTSYDQHMPAFNDSGSWLTVQHGGYANYAEHKFLFGAPETHDPKFMIGSEVLTDDGLRNLLILGDSEKEKSKVAQDIARQALDKGWGVAVLAGETQYSDWKESFGGAVELWRRNVDIMIDHYTRARRREDVAAREGKKFTPWVLFVDGYAEEEKPTAREQLGEVALVNFVRGGSLFYNRLPVVMTSQKTPWFHDLFSKVAVMSGSSTVDETRKRMVDMNLRSLSDSEVAFTYDGILCDFDNRSAGHVAFNMDGSVPVSQ